MVDLSKIELKHFNSHDIEDVALCDFLRFFQNRIGSVLDVGAHDSVRHYCREAKRIVNGKYEGIDILPDPNTALLVDKYHVGNLMDLNHHTGFDAVFSISAIEHCGITTYKSKDWRQERMDVFDRMLANAHLFVFLTFPFGEEGLVLNQYANVTDEDLREFNSIAKGDGFSALAFDFYFCSHPQMKLPWEPISRDKAARVPLNPEIEVQNVACCSWMKM